MFDTIAGDVDLASLPIVELGGLVAANGVQRRMAGAQSLVLAAAWADVHDWAVAPEFSVRTERSCFYGGKGTPMVGEFCAGEFAALQGLSYGIGRGMIADALDVRHRLPLLWRSIRAGEVHGWKAQQIASATRELDVEAARDVDAALCGLVESLPWPRFQRILVAAVLEADPLAAAERAERARARRDVWVADSEDGIKAVIARLDAGDAVLFVATVNRLADIFADGGDTDPVGQRRAKAVALLARPAEAAALLVAHRHDRDPHADAAIAPAGPDPVSGPGPGPEPEADEQPEAPAESPQPADLDDLDPDFDLDGLDEPVEAGTEPLPDPLTVAEKSHLSLDLGLGPCGSLSARDLRRLRPRVVLYFHVSDAAVRDGHGLVRPEHGDSMTLLQLRDWLADTGCSVQVRPVVVPADIEPVDGYEIPARVRAAVRLREIADTFPWGSCTAATMDLDHTERYVPPDHGGPPGQTGVDTLGPLSRSPHRAATHGEWGKRQPSPGLYVWRSPQGWIYLVTNHGTTPLGRTPYARAVWQAAVGDHVLGA